jgi:hypothetical protein
MQARPPREVMDASSSLLRRSQELIDVAQQNLAEVREQIRRATELTIETALLRRDIRRNRQRLHRLAARSRGEKQP